MDLTLAEGYGKILTIPFILLVGLTWVFLLELIRAKSNFFSLIINLFAIIFLIDLYNTLAQHYSSTEHALKLITLVVSFIAASLASCFYDYVKKVVI